MEWAQMVCHNWGVQGWGVHGWDVHEWAVHEWGRTTTLKKTPTEWPKIIQIAEKIGLHRVKIGVCTHVIFVHDFMCSLFVI